MRASRRWQLAMGMALVAGLVAGAYASVCPVMLVSGLGEPDQIVITFRNAGKLPIQRLELNCLAEGSAGVCRETNALFYPGMEYTLRYPYPAGKRDVVTVSLKNATTSDGFVWKGSKKLGCRTLRIVPPKSR